MIVSHGLYSSVVERQSCKLKVLGSIPSGGFTRLGLQYALRVASNAQTPRSFGEDAYLYQHV
jgi:hypothetical protein